MTEGVALRAAVPATRRRSPRSACAAGPTRTPSSWTCVCWPAGRSRARRSGGTSGWRDDTRTVVAHVAGRIAGYATVGARRDADATPAVGELAGLYVDPPAQGAGVGTVLLADAVARLRGGGFTSATLWVFEENGAPRPGVRRSATGAPAHPGGGAGREGANWHGPALRYRRDL